MAQRETNHPSNKPGNASPKTHGFRIPNAAPTIKLGRTISTKVNKKTRSAEGGWTAYVNPNVTRPKIIPGNRPRVKPANGVSNPPVPAATKIRVTKKQIPIK